MDETYQAPELVVVGTVESLTAANTRNTYLDAHYMAGEKTDHGIRNPVTS